jgi:hypothetical protein
MSQAQTNAANTLASEAETVLSALCELLDYETNAVRNADFNTFRSIQSDKHAMLARYKSLMDTVTKQSAASPPVNEVLAQRLKVIINRFHESADRNAKTLEAGRNSVQRITDRIIKGARETINANRQTYNYAGHSSANNKGPISVRVDEIL